MTRAAKPERCSCDESVALRAELAALRRVWKWWSARLSDTRYEHAARSIGLSEGSGGRAPCVCAEIDPSDRPCMVCDCSESAGIGPPPGAKDWPPHKAVAKRSKAKVSR